MIKIIKTESELDKEFAYRSKVICTYCERQIKRSDAGFIAMGCPFAEAFLHRECAAAAAARIFNLFDQL